MADERYEAGRQDTTLARHEEHLEEINGSVERTSLGLIDLTAEVRSLREEGQARARTTAFRWKMAAYLNGVAILALTIVSILRGSPF